MKLKCDYCGGSAALVTGAVIYPHRPDLHNLKFWHCEPCAAWVGCHKHSKSVPLGRLANAELRSAKSAAHAAFDPLWKSGGISRSDAYSWLSKKMGISGKDCHIGMFDAATCGEVIRICGER